MGESRVNITKVDTETKFALIEYPGLVKNDEKAIETLGGILKISNVLSSDKGRMELKFRPDSIYRKPTFGDIHRNTGLLLRVRVKHKDDKNADEPALYKIEILGCVVKAVKFDSLCDFQYLPIQKKSKTEKAEFIYDKIVPKGFPNPEWIDQDQPVFFPPAVFARDHIQSNLFRGDLGQDSTDDSLGISVNKKKSGWYITFTSNDPIPVNPIPSTAKQMTVKFITDEQFQKVKKLFEECPIWPRIALLYETGVNPTKLKFILPAVGYYYTTGPWRTMWVRYGYDPRKDFGSRYHQTFDFRLRQALGVNEYVKIKREVLRQNRIRGHTSKPDDQEIDYPYFDEGTLPRSRQCLFRYSDLRYPKIKDMLGKVPTPLSGAACNEKSGWLPPGFDEQCRQILSTAIVAHFRKLKTEENRTQDEYYEDLSDDDYYDDEAAEFDGEDVQLSSAFAM